MERCFDVDLDQVSFNGTVHVDAELDLPDALDLDDSITTGAARLAALGCEESLDVRRSLAAGALARRELTLDLPAGDADGPDRPGTPAPRKRELVIYVHLADGAINGAVAGVENTRSAISVEQVQDWCTGTNTTVTIRPVVDLTATLSTGSFRPTEVMREQTVLTNATCVYPHCSRPSRSADPADHGRRGHSHVRTPRGGFEAQAWRPSHLNHRGGRLRGAGTPGERKARRGAATDRNDGVRHRRHGEPSDRARTAQRNRPHHEGGPTGRPPPCPRCRAAPRSGHARGA